MKGFERVGRKSEMDGGIAVIGAACLALRRFLDTLGAWTCPKCGRLNRAGARACAHCAIEDVDWIPGPGLKLPGFQIAERPAPGLALA